MSDRLSKDYIEQSILNFKEIYAEEMLIAEKNKNAIKKVQYIGKVQACIDILLWLKTGEFK